MNRLRGFFAYAKGGTRFLDLYREGASLVAGHRMKGVGTGLKNFLEKGSWGRYPGVWRSRAEKALVRQFSGYASISYFPTVQSCLGAVAERAGASGLAAVHDPGCGEVQASTGSGPLVSVWRPFLPVPEASWLIPWLPYSGTFMPVVLLGPHPLFLQGYAPNHYQFALVPRLLSGVEGFQEEACENLWNRFSHSLWHRCGPYIRPGVTPAVYARLFSLFLSRGILLSPDISSPSVLPLEASDGEIARFINASEEFNG